ncbi:Ubiquinol-cytochrome-c reductase complex subunit 6 [Mycena kentingensis (nom. inval.)]|nr:Ubiquinol-cytochrome-c reductase complex subunit 6 [Mycena kentingensis (nom. inval.)]
MATGPLGLSLAPYIKASPTLTKIFTPISKWYANGALYRQYGLLYDDLLIEERPDVQKALSRLTPREAYDRAFRIKRASQADVLHAPLAKELWTKPEDDIRYLLPHVEAVEAENKERAHWDTLAVSRLRK